MSILIKKLELGLRPVWHWCVIIVFVHVILNCIEGERDVIAVDSNSAVERELRVREELRQPRSCKASRNQPDVWSCRYSNVVSYSHYTHSDPTE